VVFDTVLFVSAFLTPGGLAYELLRLARRRRFLLWTSEEILAETRRSLLQKAHIREKYLYTDEEVLRFLEALRKACSVATALPTVSGVTPDPHDDKIIACALAARADSIVSRDAHLLNLQAYQGITMLTPEEFIRLLREHNDRE
jgi:putative PIN family toxin of toxin-antitoxin system